MNVSPTRATPANAPVLVIEDEPAVVAFIQAALERSGYRVETAPSGVDALRMLGDGRYCGIVSDMRTPGGVNGADVHAWITTHRSDLLGRIIFVTGDTVNEETARLLNETGAPCIEKPFRVADLIAAVRERFGSAQTGGPQ
jgi:DNA-binding response OmpR family regulator